ncbi:hypothetical protein IT568_00255 [bacterium]|nr:hypothetical protein [bacterium]
MFYKWLISNCFPNKIEKLKLSFSSEKFHFYSEKKPVEFTFQEKEFYILIDGYLLPKQSDIEVYKNFSQEEIVFELFKKYGENFINHIKGQFNLIIIVNNSFYIFTDWVGIKKTFYFYKDRVFLFSNDIKLISGNIKVEFDKENILIYTLMYHFMDGKTLLKNVFFTQPASKISFKNDLDFDTFWNYGELLNKQSRNVSFEEIAELYRNNLKSYLSFLKPNGVSASLTGGSDTRVTLAGFLSLEIKPHLYTFGDPESYDAVVAKKISQKFGLEHSIYNFPNPTFEWFSNSVDEIIKLGNSITSIHRVHRLESIKKESKHGEMLFLGSLGGEIIKGEFLNDYILTELIRRWWAEKEDKKEIISDILSRHFVRTESVNLDALYDYFSKQKYLGNDTHTNQLYAVFEIVARLHDPQDMYLFYHHLNYVVPSFLDIEYLNLIFESKYNLLHKNFTNSNNPLRRVDNPFYQANLLNALYPKLTEIEMASFYSHQEYLQNKYFCITKKIIREKFGRKKYPPNFILGDWFKDFVEKSLENVNDDLTNEIFDLEKLKRVFRTTTHDNVEKYWTKYSQIINLSLLSKEFQ